MKKLILLVFAFVFSIGMNAQSIWSVEQEKDKYGDVIPGSQYLYGEFKGTFSNNATTNGSLSVAFLMNKEYSFLLLMLHNQYKAPLDTSLNLWMYVKKGNGEEVKYLMKPRRDGILFFNEESEKNDFISLLLKENTLKCYYMDRSKDTYIFTINCNGFTKNYQKAKTSWNN